MFLRDLLKRAASCGPVLSKVLFSISFVFSLKFAAESFVVVVQALAMTVIAPLAVVPSLLGRQPLPRCPCLVLVLDHGCIYFLRIRLIDMITMNAMIAFAQCVARGWPCPPYKAMCAIIEHVPRQHTVMQTGSVRILNSMYS